MKHVGSEISMFFNVSLAGGNPLTPWHLLKGDFRGPWRRGLEISRMPAR